MAKCREDDSFAYPYKSPQSGSNHPNNIEHLSGVHKVWSDRFVVLKIDEREGNNNVVSSFSLVCECAKLFSFFLFLIPTNLALKEK